MVNNFFKKIPNNLSEKLIRGVWSTCGECGHGGHLEHMEQWFSKFDFCPFLGCNHHCKERFFKRKR